MIEEYSELKPRRAAFPPQRKRLTVLSKSDQESLSSLRSRGGLSSSLRSALGFADSDHLFGVGPCEFALAGPVRRDVRFRRDILAPSSQLLSFAQSPLHHKRLMMHESRHKI